MQLELVEKRTFVCYVVGACNKTRVDTTSYMDSAANDPFSRNVDRLATQRHESGLLSDPKHDKHPHAAVKEARIGTQVARIA